MTLKGFKLVATVALAIGVLPLAGCQTTKNDEVAKETGGQDINKEGKGTAIGAATGAAVGAATGTGNTRARNAVIGAVVGGLAGNRVGAYMDRQEKELRGKLEGSGVGVERKGDKIQLNMPSDITFAFGKAAIDPKFQPVLAKVTDVLKEYKDTGIKIAGYTDSVGTTQVNQALSEQRAKSVASFLEGKGVTDARITTEAHGESQPVATNDTPAGRQKNRRVQLELVPIVAH